MGGVLRSVKMVGTVGGGVDIKKRVLKAVLLLGRSRDNVTVQVREC